MVLWMVAMATSKSALKR